MEFQNYSFKPSLFATLITGLAMSVFISLAIWQWHRAEYKEGIAQLQLSQNTLAPLQLTAQRMVWPEQRFRNVALSGTFDHDHEILLDNVVRKGKAGYSVLTPFSIIGSAQQVLVDRGWIAVGNDRKQLPKIPQPAGQVSLEGVLDNPPVRPAILWGDYKPDQEGTKRWAFMDMDYLNQQREQPLQPFIVIQTSALDDGLQRVRPEIKNTAGMHIGYCIQWAAFALMAFIAYISMNTRKTGKVTT